MRFLLVYHDNNAGTPQTARLIGGLLEEAGISLGHAPIEPPGGWARLAAGLSRWRGAPQYDAVLSLEHVRAGWRSFGRRNFLVPNQEWFEESWIRHLPRYDRVFCKTRDAERIFSRLGAATTYIGFTSRDRRLPDQAWRREGVLHVAGRSLQKGTPALVRIWQRHPEWPMLTIIQRPPHPGYRLEHPPAANITYLTDYLDDEEVRRLQNTIRLHACPSEAEGFGHVLAESMSCGAVLVTTDAAPMNELVQPDRGILVSVATSAPQGVGMRHEVDEAALERALAEALTLTPERQAVLGHQARVWFEENDRRFRTGLASKLTALLPDLATRAPTSSPRHRDRARGQG